MGQTRATPGSKENMSRKWGRESLLPIHVHLLFISWPFPVIHIIIHTCLVAFYGSHEQNYSCYCSTGNTARVAVQPALLCLLEQQTCLKIRSALPDAPTRRARGLEQAASAEGAFLCREGSKTNRSCRPQTPHAGSVWHRAAIPRWQSTFGVQLGESQPAGPRL